MTATPATGLDCEAWEDAPFCAGPSEQVASCELDGTCDDGFASACPYGFDYAAGECAEPVDETGTPDGTDAVVSVPTGDHLTQAPATLPEAGAGAELILALAVSAIALGGGIFAAITALARGTR